MPTPSPVPQHPGRNKANICTPWTKDALIPAYEYALGQFFRQFGQTESTLSNHLEEFVVSQLDPHQKKLQIIRALLGSKRTPELYNTSLLVIKGAIVSGSAHTQQDVEDLGDLYKQLSEIRFLRDKIAHYAVHPEPVGPEVWFRTVDIYTVRDIAKAKWILFKIEHLDAAYNDLRAICHRVPQTMFPERRHGDPMPESVQEHYEPWRYKPSELKRKKVRLMPSPQPPVPLPLTFEE